MDIELLSAVGELTTTAILLLVLWQGLKRFDLLLQVIVELATRVNLSDTERTQLADKLSGKVNGSAKR